jgi:hypothetical protein
VAFSFGINVLVHGTPMILVRLSASPLQQHVCLGCWFRKGDSALSTAYSLYPGACRSMAFHGQSHHLAAVAGRHKPLTKKASKVISTPSHFLGLRICSPHFSLVFALSLFLSSLFSLYSFAHSSCQFSVSWRHLTIPSTKNPPRFLQTAH